eukprot:gene5668-7692_t
MAVVLRGGYVVRHGAAEWGDFFRRVATEFPVPRLSDADARGLAEGFVCDFISTRHKIERGEFLAAQRWLHQHLAEVNFQLLHELRQRRGEVSFPDARRIERVFPDWRLVQVDAVPRAESGGNAERVDEGTRAGVALAVVGGAERAKGRTEVRPTFGRRFARGVDSRRTARRAVPTYRGLGLSGEEFGDHVFEGDVLDRDVGYRAGAEDFLRDGHDVFTWHAEGEFAVVRARRRAEARLPRVGEGDGVAGEEGDDFFARTAGVLEAVEGAVVDLGAFVDHDHAFAEFLDVGHVVAREENRDAMFAVILAEELADGALRDDVEADGGFVEEEDARAVEERGDELHLH